MSKVAVYIGILATVLIGYHLFGVIDNTSILGYILNPSQFFELDFYQTILVSVAGVAVAGIVVGSLFVTGKTDFAISILMGTFLLATGQDLIAIYNVLADILPDLALILFAPLILIYSLTIFEWMRGIA